MADGQGGGLLSLPPLSSTAEFQKTEKTLAKLSITIAIPVVYGGFRSCQMKMISDAS